MKSDTIWSVFLIAILSGYVHGIPIQADSGNSYKLEILSKNNHNSPPTTSENILSKLDLSSFYETVVKNVVPVLLSKRENGATPGKETTYQLGRSLTEGLTKSITDAFNSKLGQELLITAGLKKRPSLLEIVYETIVEYLKWIGTITSNKIHEVGDKGLFQTLSDTYYSAFGTHSHVPPHQSSQKIQHKPDILTGKHAEKHPTETYMEPRDILDRLQGVRHRLNGGPPPPPMPIGPWNTFFYKPMDPNYPYSSLPYFMGGGPFAYIGYLISSAFYYIQEFFSTMFNRGPPPPPPGGRPSILRRPPQPYPPHPYY